MSIEQYEVAARRYCELKGINPDEQEHYADPNGLAVYRTRPRWMNVAERLEDMNLMFDAMMYQAAQEIKRDKEA